MSVDYTEAEQEQIKVRKAENMTRQLFIKHMEVRHYESVCRFKYIDDMSDEYLERCWRAYHRQIHALGLQGDLDHYHAS